MTRSEEPPESYEEWLACFQRLQERPLEAILSNTKALDSGKALVEVLKRMEDGEEKRSALLRICKTRTLPPELKESLERYVADFKIRYFV